MIQIILMIILSLLIIFIAALMICACILAKRCDEEIEEEMNEKRS